MSGPASMLDEIADPSAPKLWTCKCCKFSFRVLDKYVDHLTAQLMNTSAELSAATKEQAKLKEKKG